MGEHGVDRLRHQAHGCHGRVLHFMKLVQHSSSHPFLHLVVSRDRNRRRAPGFIIFLAHDDYWQT